MPLNILMDTVLLLRSCPLLIFLALGDDATLFNKKVVGGLQYFFSLRIILEAVCL